MSPDSTNTNPPLDASVVQRHAADPHASVWVNASAGTGKTKVLTDRILRLLLAGVRPTRILALTFTKAGAAEMSIRMQQRLGGWMVADDARLDAQLRDLLGAAGYPTVNVPSRLLSREPDQKRARSGSQRSPGGNFSGWAEKSWLFRNGERDGLARRRVRVLSGAGRRRR